MFNKVKEINKLLSMVQDMKKNPPDIKNTSDIFKHLGLDINEIETEVSKSLGKFYKLRYTLLDESAIAPKYNYESDSGFDLHSIEEVTLKPFGRALIRTGLRFEIPLGTELQIRPKSGLALKQGLTVLNTPGTVDQGYTGEVMVIVFNTNNEEFTIKKGMKIAQGVLCPVHSGRMVEIHQVVDIKENERGDKGFGSTGI